MDTPEIVGRATHESGATPTRNPRATKKVMEARERAIISLIVEKGSTNAYVTAQHLGLTYAQVVTLLSNMVNKGTIKRAGNDGKKATFTLLGADETPTPAKARRVRRLSAVPAVSLLEHFHLGATVEVVGLRIEDEQPRIELRADGERFQVALV